MLLWENVIELLVIPTLWSMWFMTSLLLSMVLLLEYLCHSILAVSQISQNNYTLSQCLDGILSYHLGFSFPINTLLFCHENACFPSSLPFDIRRQPTSSVYCQVLRVYIYIYISYQLPVSKLSKKKCHCHPGGLLSLWIIPKPENTNTTNTKADKLRVLLILHSHLISKLLLSPVDSVSHGAKNPFLSGLLQFSQALTQSLE